MISDILNRLMEGATKLAPVLDIVLTLALFLLGFLLNRQSRKIEKLTIWKGHRDDIKAFADESIKVLSEVEGLCEQGPSENKQQFKDTYNSLIIQISVLRDKGKLILPNLHHTSYGTHKSRAYRGIRLKILEALAAAFHITTAIDYSQDAYNKKAASLEEIEKNNPGQYRKLTMGLSKLPEGYEEEGFDKKGWSCKRGIIEAKRQFVSEAQDLIDPRRWGEEVRFIQGR